MLNMKLLIVNGRLVTIHLEVIMRLNAWFPSVQIGNDPKAIKQREQIEVHTHSMKTMDREIGNIQRSIS